MCILSNEQGPIPNSFYFDSSDILQTKDNE